MADPFELERFVKAQDDDNAYERAAKELRAGRKQTGWMWFVFPQVKGLGSSSSAVRYAIGSRNEAVAYLAHHVLGPRLHRCAQLVVRSGAVNANTLMGGYPNDRKLQSSMTLFAEVADHDADFVAVLRKYYRGQRDAQTLRLLKSVSTTTAVPVAQSQDSLSSEGRSWRLWPSRRGKG
jgi:uncharacterized protein (DUF1810 family)